MLHFLRVVASFGAPKTPFTLYFSLFLANSPAGDRFDCDCVRHQQHQWVMNVFLSAI